MLNKLFYKYITRYNYFMDKREFTVIENDIKVEEKIEKKSVIHATNPIVKKFAEFHRENLGKFSVKDLFKK